jgi:hypothetical protein
VTPVSGLTILPVLNDIDVFSHETHRQELATKVTKATKRPFAWAA